MTSLFLLIAFTLSTAQAGGESGGIQAPVSWVAPAPLLAEITSAEAGLGAIGLIITLIGYHFAARKYIREQAGVKDDPKPREITPSPFVVTSAKEWATLAQLAELRGEVHNQLTELRTYMHQGMHDLRNAVNDLSLEGREREDRLIAKLDEHWKHLTHERSVSIARLHEKIEATAKALGEEIDVKVGEPHERINTLAEKVGELVGELRAMRPTGGRPR